MRDHQDSAKGSARKSDRAAQSSHSTWKQRVKAQGRRWYRLRGNGRALVMAVMVFLGLFVLQSWVVDKYFSNESAIVARSTAVMGSGAYASAARDDIVVLELNDPYLELMGETWPPSYALYQAIFDDVAQYQPAAVFFDIALVHSRTAEGVQALFDSMCRLHHQKTRVYLAALENAQGQLYVRKELEALLEKEPCFTKVGVRYDADPHTHLASTYPLMGNGERPWLDGDNKAVCARQAIHSAAYQIARDVMGVDPAVQPISATADCPQVQPQGATLPRTMSLTWAMRSHVSDSQRPMWIHCKVEPNFLIELIPTPLRNIAGLGVMPCPYHRHVPLTDIAVPAEGEHELLKTTLGGKYVMVGAAVQGIQDVVNSPIHGYIPGVYLHAMALDNMLTQWPHIKPVEAAGGQMLVVLLLAGVLGAVCYVMYGLIQAVFGLQQSRRHLRGVSVCQRLCNEVRYVGSWLSAKVLEVCISLVLTWLVFQWLLNHSSYSIQALAQLLAVVFALQWTGITDKVFRSLLYIFTPQKK